LEKWSQNMLAKLELAEIHFGRVDPEAGVALSRRGHSVVKEGLYKHFHQHTVHVFSLADFSAQKYD